MVTLYTICLLSDFYLLLSCILFYVYSSSILFLPQPLAMHCSDLCAVGCRLVDGNRYSRVSPSRLVTHVPNVP